MDASAKLGTRQNPPDLLNFFSIINNVRVYYLVVRKASFQADELWGCIKVCEL